MNVIIATGGFDPLHSGHIEYLRAAAELGDMLIVGLNSNEWLTRKKGQCFMDIKDRAAVVGGLRFVGGTATFDDSDGSAKTLIRNLLDSCPTYTFTFVNGGDRDATNIPEMEIQHARLSFKFGVGGTEKLNSSSSILERWTSPPTARQWGEYRVLAQEGKPGAISSKLKVLEVQPGRSLSMQRHTDRTELWFVVSGSGMVEAWDDSTGVGATFRLPLHATHRVFKNQWHRLYNPNSVPLKIIEIQYGENCNETDIQRL